MAPFSSKNLRQKALIGNAKVQSEEFEFYVLILYFSFKIFWEKSLWVRKKYHSDLLQRVRSMDRKRILTKVLLHYQFIKHLETSADAIRYAKGDPNVFVYSRYHNPTVKEVEEKIALLYDAEDAVLFSSGMAAITTAIQTLVKPGNTIISTPALYGGTYRWFRDELENRGVHILYIDLDSLDRIPSMVDDTTALIYFETPTNPTLNIVDIAEIARQTGKRAQKLVNQFFQ